mmetsp:Transcript_14623/g.31705  ORF Transcript_14623/g.31705 Transcript_14623/m.31705 type:complete len:453 (-) Transcript_14623:50-1408(-)
MRLQAGILVLVLSRILGASVAVRQRYNGPQEDECVDDASYESKLGMKCSDHSSFVCEELVSTNFLSGHELDNLLESCPVSCRVPRCEKYLPPLEAQRRGHVEDAPMGEERDLLITFPSQDGDRCFIGWDPSCKDDPSYASPLGGLPCSAYVNTQCALFRHVGFTEAEMLAFINSCPCSCGIECNTWTLPPTMQPTTAPTGSTKPSASPSGNPTFSVAPSPMHSESPSSQPTKQACVAGWENSCQDDETYISPQGSICSSFSNFDCTLFIGIYSSDEFLDLVNSCPCTCNIECGTYTKAPSPTPSMAPSGSPPVSVSVTSTPFEVQMSPVESLMDPLASGTFQNTLMSMTLSNFALLSPLFEEADVQLSFGSFLQSRPSASILSVTSEFVATVTVPAVGPGVPDPSSVPTVDELDTAIAMVFAVPDPPEFLAGISTSPALASVTNVVFSTIVA